jgi:hypothetical protein
VRVAAAFNGRRKIKTADLDLINRWNPSRLYNWAGIEGWANAFVAAQES